METRKLNKYKMLTKNKRGGRGGWWKEEGCAFLSAFLSLLHKNTLQMYVSSMAGFIYRRITSNLLAQKTNSVRPWLNSLEHPRGITFCVWWPCRSCPSATCGTAVQRCDHMLGCQLVGMESLLGNIAAAHIAHSEQVFSRLMSWIHSFFSWQILLRECGILWVIRFWYLGKKVECWY